VAQVNAKQRRDVLGCGQQRSKGVAVQFLWQDLRYGFRSLLRNSSHARAGTGHWPKQRHFYGCERGTAEAAAHARTRPRDDAAGLLLFKTLIERLPSVAGRAFGRGGAVSAAARVYIVVPHRSVRLSDSRAPCLARE
jgi:hypothetical protein